MVTFCIKTSTGFVSSGGDVFGKHIDGSNQTALGRTEYTLLVYLTGYGDGLEGGRIGSGSWLGLAWDTL